MMTPKLEALARRAVACEGWRLVPGMRVYDVGSCRTGRVYEAGENWIVFPGLATGTRIRADAIAHRLIPDFSDLLTVQAVALPVREVWGDVEFCMTFSPWNGQWRLEAVFYCDDKALPYRHHYEASSLAEALVSALEAADDAA